VVTDDDTGWTEVLLDSWRPAVRDAVVERVERSTVGRRGMLVRTLASPDDARYAWTEQLHRLVLDAIRDEVGADLEELGSQAAWTCYEDVWSRLARRWADGGPLAAVRRGDEVRARRLIAQLTTSLAEAAAADVATVPPEPLVVAGRVRIDRDGLWAAVATLDLDRRQRAVVDALVELTEPGPRRE
jgi:hypothetical protein